MKKDEYIKTLNIADKEIQLGLDDYGQCYFIEWIDDSGEKQSTGLGTYNANYLQDIYYLFDPEYKELSRKAMWGDYMTPEEKNKLHEYCEIFDKEYLKNRNTSAKGYDEQVLETTEKEKVK